MVVKVPPFPSHKETMPAFLIPNTMEPTSADVGTHRTVDELKVAKVKAIVKILVDAWIRIGVGRLKELMARRS